MEKHSSGNKFKEFNKLIFVEGISYYDAGLTFVCVMLMRSVSLCC